MKTTPDNHRPTLLTYLMLVALVLVPLFAMIGPYLVSLASGAVLAVLFLPLFARLSRRMKPAWAALLVTTGVGVGVLGPVTLLVIGAIRQASAVVQQLARGDALSVERFAAMVHHSLPFTDVLGSPEELQVQLGDAINSAAQALSVVALNQLRALPEMALQLVLVLLSIYFFLVDGGRLFRWITGKIPLSEQIWLALVASVRTATTAVVLASMAASGAAALTILVAFYALGVPAAFLAAGAAFVLAWVPGGTFLVWGGATAYLFWNGHPVSAAIMVGVGVLLGVLENLVRPLVLRGRQEMHPMVSLLAILGGLALFGVPGAFLGPLLASLAIAILDLWPVVASYCGVAVRDSGEVAPEVAR